MEIDNYINGERLQNIAEIYLGTTDDFVENPRILEQIERHIVLCDVGPMFNNPRFVFLYPHRLQLFTTKLKHFMNPFVLISHNSDVNLTENNEYVRQIMADEKLICWWGQNLCFINPKMRFLPIGLANTMCIQENILEQPCEKSRGLYLNFRIYTNVDKRRQCADALNSRADGGMLPMVNAQENWKRLSTYKWCACPEGNGADTHRIWEALYMKCIPIVVKSPFIDALMYYTNNELPICVVDSWWDFELPPYEAKVFEKVNKWLTLRHYVKIIQLSIGI
jgi:hypothetical protein